MTMRPGIWPDDTGKVTEEDTSAPLDIRRPRTEHGSMTVDKESITMIKLLGGRTIEQVALTRGQEDALYKLYGYCPQPPRGELQRAARFRNMTRHARNDGMRVVAFLARFCQPGQDPLQIVRCAMSEVGYDVMLEEEDDEV